MANYNIVVDTSNFKPYTFDDIIKPALMYDLAWDKERESALKYIDEYGNLNLPMDSLAGRDYQNMMEQLLDAMESFYSDSLKLSMPKMMRAFDLLRGRGAKLKAAATAYEKYQDNLTSLGGDAIIGNPLTIDDFYLGKPTSIHSVSRKDIINGAAAYAKGLVAGILGDPTFKLIYDGMLLLNFSTSAGMSNADIVNAALEQYAGMNPDNAEKVSAARQHMLAYTNSLGLDREHGFNADAQKLIANAVANGFVSALTNTATVVSDTSRDWVAKDYQNRVAANEAEKSDMEIKYLREHPEAIAAETEGKKSTTSSSDSDSIYHPAGLVYKKDGASYVDNVFGNTFPLTREKIQERNDWFNSLDDQLKALNEWANKKRQKVKWDPNLGVLVLAGKKDTELVGNPDAAHKFGKKTKKKVTLAQVDEAVKEAELARLDSIDAAEKLAEAAREAAAEKEEKAKEEARKEAERLKQVLIEAYNKARHAQEKLDDLLHLKNGDIWVPNGDFIGGGRWANPQNDAQRIQQEVELKQLETKNSLNGLMNQ